MDDDEDERPRHNSWYAVQWQKVELKMYARAQYSTFFCNFQSIKGFTKMHTVELKLKWLNTKVCINFELCGKSKTLDNLDKALMCPRLLA